MPPRHLCAIVILAALFSACSDDPSTGVDPNEAIRLVPQEYGSIGEAAAAAQSGDRIIVTGRAQAYEENVVLTGSIDLVSNQNEDMPRIQGSVRLVGAGEDARVERLEIVNPEGDGLILQDSRAQVSGVYLHGCAGSALRLSGNSPAEVQGCDFEASAAGVTVADVSAYGHYDDAEFPAASINNCNFLGNGGGGELRHIVFENIGADYTINVDQNFWGAPVASTIFGQSPAGGKADTDYNGFVAWVDTLPREWRD